GHLGDARDGWRLHLRHRRRRALALGCEAAPPPRRLGRRRLGDVLDDLDELVRAVALRAREADELAGAGDHRSLLGRARHVNAAAAPELEQSLVAEDAERAEDGVRVDAENRREIACGRETVAGIRLSVGDRPPDLRCDLMEESGRFRRIDLDTQHRANHTSTMSGHAPALPLGVDPLIAEAKERARRRRLLALAAAGILVVAGVAIALAGFGGSGSPGTVPWLPTRPNIGPANPPLAPACTASQLKASLFMQGASMSLVGGITIANRGAGPCALVGRPRLSFAGATSKWRETTYHAQNVLPLQYDPLAPPAGSLRALAPGEHVQVLVWWSNWCGRGSTKSGDSGRPARAMVLSAPGGGRLLLHNGPRRSFFAPVCNGGPGSASVLEATHFAPYVPQEPPSSHIPLTAAIGPSQAVKIKGTKLTQPSFVARPGFWLSFTVTLTN